jgi:hypothetical protein
MRENNPALAARAWNEFLNGFHRTAGQRFPMTSQHLQGPQVLAAIDEVSWMETNHSSQWSLNLIELMGMVGAYAPTALPDPWRV